MVDRMSNAPSAARANIAPRATGKKAPDDPRRHLDRRCSYSNTLGLNSDSPYYPWLDRYCATKMDAGS